MSAARADAKKRVVIPGARPGDVFDIQRQDDERYLLVRLPRPETMSVKSREACFEAMATSPLRLMLPWKQLRQSTREL